MSRWIWASDNRDALNLDFITHIDIFFDDPLYNVVAYFTTGSGEGGRTVARDLTLSEAQDVVEEIIAEVQHVTTPVAELIDYPD